MLQLWKGATCFLGRACSPQEKEVKIFRRKDHGKKEVGTHLWQSSVKNRIAILCVQRHKQSLVLFKKGLTMINLDILKL